MDSSIQTTRTGLEEERLMQLRKDKMALTEEVAHLRNEWALAQRQAQNARRQVQILHQDLKKLKDDHTETLAQKLKWRNSLKQSFWQAREAVGMQVEPALHNALPFWSM